jgi:hypothetical protein
MQLAVHLGNHQCDLFRIASVPLPNAMNSNKRFVLFRVVLRHQHKIRQRQQEEIYAYIYANSL